MHVGARFPLAGVFLVLAVTLAGAAAPNGTDAAYEQNVAESLATLLQAARGVISEQQKLIDDPALGDKRLSGRAVLDMARATYRRMRGRDPYDTDPRSLEGVLLRAEMDAIVAVMDSNQASINVRGVGFKGFIPAVFARLVTEAFATRVDGRATMKVTAPIELVRNRKSRPDAWETDVIDRHFRAPGWPSGAPFAETVRTPSGPIFRLAVPEYYGPSCLACHGMPKGALDITGYPKEGARLGDLGGVISVILAR